MQPPWLLPPFSVLLIFWGAWNTWPKPASSQKESGFRRFSPYFQVITCQRFSSPHLLAPPGTFGSWEPGKPGENSAATFSESQDPSFILCQVHLGKAF